MLVISPLMAIFLLPLLQGSSDGRNIWAAIMSEGSTALVWLLPLLVGFCHISLFFLHFCLFCSHLSFISAHWQDSLVEKLGTAAWLNTWPPPGRKKFWQEDIEFWQDEVVGPP